MTSSGKRRVSILASDLSSQGAGRWGGAVRPFLLSQALIQAGYQPEIVGFNRDATPLKNASDDVPIHSIPLGGELSGWQASNRLLQALQGDIIYAYKLKPTSFGLALLHRLRHRKPVILDIDDWELSWHGGDDWAYRPPSVKQLLRDVLKKDGALRDPDHPLYLKWIQNQVHRADAVTTHNGFLQEKFGGIYIPNGKDIALFDPDQYNAETCRQELGLSNYRVLLFPGAPRPYKGVEDLLIALDILDQPDLKLVIVGGSPYDDYDAQLQKKWGHRLIQLPKASYTEMPKRIAAAHIVVVPQRQHPSAQAQFPLKLTDGMAMAKPILATKVGDIPKILGNTGYLVDSDQPQELAREIQNIFDAYGVALNKGEMARQRCIEHYSIQRMSQVLSTFLPELILN
ncbi:MAG: glycosyltransferase family 4 protein [Leptolyngbyaceae cyanobacterium]